MDDWLSRRADALAERAGVPRSTFELSDADVNTLLELASRAAHESGERTNAPLLCFLIGAATRGPKNVDELAEIVKSTS